MLVIFDCDGVLVDSESLAAEIFSESLKGIGIELDARRCFQQFKGHTLEACFTWLEREFKRPLPGNYLDTLNRQTREGFAQRLKTVDGVEQLIEKLLAHKIPICVASNGGASKVDFSLQTTGLARFFDESERFTVDCVEVGKPAPDLFLFAAESMGVPPEFCWVIEDSPTGWKAAQAAGMQLMKFAPADDGADVFKSMTEVQAALLSLVNVPA